MEVFFINNTFSYAIFPLKLITDEKILYVLILNRLNYSKKNLKHFEDTKGIFVYYSNKQIQEHLGCCDNTATKALRNLEKVELIRKEYQKNGLPLKIYVNDIRVFNTKSAPSEKETSFDIVKAEQSAKSNRQNFGDKKNKRRTNRSAL